MTDVTQQSDAKDPIFKYQAWWGLAGCGVIMGIIMLLGPFHEFELTPREYAFDYPWKLPDPNAWTRFTAWSLYALHQVGIWYLIYKAQSQKLRYVNGLHKENVQMFILNVVFVALHIAQTKYTYDGLAQDVHEATAFASVAMMLFVIMIMENDRRGLLFGKKVPLPMGVGEAAKKYHGYYFSWAITYTFWYHPIETTQGHLMGLFYMMMLFLQSSLFMTRFHVNRWWTFTLEFFMVVHGTTVAYVAIQQNGTQWSQFLFGGLIVLLVTQMHGLALKTWHKAVITALCFGGGFLYYSQHIEKLEEIPRMFGTRYAAVLIMVCLIWLIMRPFIWSGKKVPGIAAKSS